MRNQDDVATMDIELNGKEKFTTTKCSLHANWLVSNYTRKIAITNINVWNLLSSAGSLSFSQIQLPCVVTNPTDWSGIKKNERVEKLFIANYKVQWRICDTVGLILLWEPF
ncbi:hypothetical protein AMECASPLE_022614 [Ameca splendens]|uniref:Uncharacterized protein n=1 Tax=Ameca splendens TaxID=208324 RepID=A0ABV0XSX0_9TELE